MIHLQAAKVLNSHAQVWNMLGRCQVSSGDVTDGIRSYQRSLRIQDSSREAWFNLAQANKEVGLLCSVTAGLAVGCSSPVWACLQRLLTSCCSCCPGGAAAPWVRWVFRGPLCSYLLPQFALTT